MKVTDLTPNDYWQTDLIDLRLGEAVQKAWQEGQETAREGHQAAERAMKDIAARHGGTAQC